jgi:hypothetical protein
MTEGDYIKAIELIREAEKNIRHGEYDFAHINVLEALEILDGEDEDNNLTNVRNDDDDEVSYEI